MNEREEPLHLELKLITLRTDVPITSNCCTKAAADAAFVVHYHSDRGSETKRSETEARHQLTHWVNWDVVVQGGQWW